MSDQLSEPTRLDDPKRPALMFKDKAPGVVLHCNIEARLPELLRNVRG